MGNGKNLKMALASQKVDDYGNALVEANMESMMLKLFLMGEIGMTESTANKVLEDIAEQAHDNIQKDEKAMLILDYFGGKKSYAHTMKLLADLVMGELLEGMAKELADEQ